MNQPEKIINQYFKLSDQASNDQEALNSIIKLFANDSTVQSATGDTCIGIPNIRHFFQAFFERNEQLKHLCRVFVKDSKYQAEWAVSGRKKTDELFALHGYDTYTFNSRGQIQTLRVEISE